MSTPVRKREPIKVETSESGRRYVSIRELVRGEMERVREQSIPVPPVNGNGSTRNGDANPERGKKRKKAAG